MLIVVTWHDPTTDGSADRKARLVEVRDRADGHFYEEGVLRQAMRQYGYEPHEITAAIGNVDPVTFTPKKEEPKRKMLCSECGSTEVCLDAFASWDIPTQQWVLHNTYDDAFCQSCERDCTIEEEEITP